MTQEAWYCGAFCTNRQSCDQNKTRSYEVKDEAKSNVLSHTVVLVIGSSGEILLVRKPSSRRENSGGIRPWRVGLLLGACET